MKQATRFVVFLSLFFIASSLLASAQAQVKIKRDRAHYTSPTSGEEMYKAYCASCHGLQAKGDGPAAPAFRADVPDLTRLAKQNGGKFPFFHIVQEIRGDVNNPSHGSKEMPIWGPVFMSVSDRQPAQVVQRMENLTKYIESLQKD